MTQEEIQALEEEKSSYRSELSRLNLKMKSLKDELEVLQDEWEEIYDKYTLADRKVAMATKLQKVGKGGGSKPKQTITPTMARELLKLLGEEVKV